MVSKKEYKEIMEKINTLEIEFKKATGIALAAIAFAVIAVAIPTFLEIMDTPNWSKGIFVVLYFSIGFYILYEQLFKVRQLKKQEKTKNGKASR